MRNRFLCTIAFSPPIFFFFQKLKCLPVDQLFKLNKLGLLKKVIDGRAPEYLITTLDSLRFEHKYSTRTKTLYRLPKPRTEAMRRTFFYSTIKELNALNLEPTTSFSLMKTTLTNNVASNYTVDNFKVKKLFWFLKIRAFFKYYCRLDSLFYQRIHFRFYISQLFKSLEFLRTFIIIIICK